MHGRTNFHDSGRLHIKRTVPKGTVRLVRLVRKFKQHTNVHTRTIPKNMYRTSVKYFLEKLWRTVPRLRSVPHSHPWPEARVVFRLEARSD